MMDYALNALAPKLEVGQEALFDALRCQDSKRATRIIQRVASRTERGEAHRSRSAGHVADREREADLNAPDSRGLRPIHLAAMAGMSESVRALLSAGIPVDTMGAEGNTALHLASFNKQEGVVAVLLNAGASPNQENIKGKTPIDLAGTEMTLTLLCPLHYAAGRGMLDNLVSLVAKGVSVRSLARGGDTPLHASAASGTPDAARLLLARGADPLKKNAAGETPLDLARRFGGDRQGIAEIVGLLEQAEAFAAVEQAEREAKEAERLAAASSGEETYEERDSVMYVRNGEENPAVVIKVHQDDEEPYYTVRVHATGRERQTDANHLVRILDPSSDGESRPGNEGGSATQDMSDEPGAGEGPADTQCSSVGELKGALEDDRSPEGVLDSARADENNSAPTPISNSGGKRFRDSDAVGSTLGPQCGEVGGKYAPNSVSRCAPEGEQGDWSLARALFREVAARLLAEEERRKSEDQSSESGLPANASQGGGSPSSATTARAIAAAFAAVPCDEVGVLLRHKVSGIHQRDGKDNVCAGHQRRDTGEGSFVGQAAGGSLYGRDANTASAGHSDGVDGGRGKAMEGENRSVFDDGVFGVGGGLERVVDGENNERVAQAIADACRDVVLKCLLGGNGRAGVARHKK